ncbi:type II secretion system protein [Eubacterium maltosivorans]|uniref:type II secretion system protein n=1 Tax=Eubacterium maltosivorans TaxID=2041044 RepID=UPI0018A10C1C|nr:type II secretion system protein [Eubacterium maltosivorans]
MIQMINKLKKNQKGFTLVELIVVLVILAILAAFTIPAMLGFIDDARGKATIAQTRELYVAAQSAASEIASGSKLTPGTGKVAKGGSTVATDTDDSAIKIAKKTKAMVNSDFDGEVLVDVSVGTSAAPTAELSSVVFVDIDGKITKVQFVSADGKYRSTVKPTNNGTSDTSAEVEKIK